MCLETAKIEQTNVDLSTLFVLCELQTAQHVLVYRCDVNAHCRCTPEYLFTLCTQMNLLLGESNHQ